MRLILLLITVVLVADVVAIEPVGDADFKAGYSLGMELGTDQAAFVGVMPQPVWIETLANGSATARAKEIQNAVSWKLGFKSGFKNGFDEAKRTWRKPTDGNEKYDQPSYWSGYKAGFKGANIEGDERTRMFRRSDLEIEKNHYKKADYDAGFRAGQADADTEAERQRQKKAEIDKRGFEKKSYEAGYRAEKKLHKHNGIPQTIEESIELNREAQKWDAKSWANGWRSANEEDTRP